MQGTAADTLARFKLAWNQKEKEKNPPPVRAIVRFCLIKAICTSKPLQQFKCDVYSALEFYLWTLSAWTSSCNTLSLSPSHTHSESYIYGEDLSTCLIFMQRLTDTIAHTCNRAPSAQFKGTRRSRISFNQKLRVLTRGTSLSSVMKTICKLFELKVKELQGHLGADCQWVFFLCATSLSTAMRK